MSLSLAHQKNIQITISSLATKDSSNNYQYLIWSTYNNYTKSWTNNAT